MTIEMMMPSIPRDRARMLSRREAGLSLTEVLIAAALLLLIAISIIPIFQRAVVSNISGGDASQVSTGGVRVGVERLNQVSLNHTDLTLPPTSNAVSLPPQVLDTGALVDGQAQAYVGDERWVSAPDWPTTSPTLAGRAAWARDTELRNYAYADIHSGVISVTGGGVVTLGDPGYFDSPLSGSDPSWDLKETRVAVRAVRDGHPLGAGQRMTVNVMRSY